MQKVDLKKVLDLLVAEEREEAGKLLHEWFVGKSKSILEDLMQEDDAALDIEDAKDEIESEEFYADVDLEEAGDEEVDGEEDFIDGEIDGEIEGEVAGDEFAAAADLEGELDAEIEVPVEDKVENLEAQIAELKAEFDRLMGVESDEAEVAADLGAFGAEEEVDGVFESDDDDSDKEELDESKDEEEDELDESVDVSDDDYADLEESYHLEPIKDPVMDGNKEVGADPEKVTVETHSPLPNRKPEDRVGGAPVEIKGKVHKGYERQPSPAVEDNKLLKNQVKNAKQDLESVPADGDKSALLNKGPAPDKGKSPIGGGAVDLRGVDFKRSK